MPELYLDSHGEDVLIAWFGTHPTFDDMDLAQDVLEAYARGDYLGARWYTTRDLITDNLVVWPHDGLRLVIRRFSDVDPEYMFTLVAIDSIRCSEEDDL